MLTTHIFIGYKQTEKGFKKERMCWVFFFFSSVTSLNISKKLIEKNIEINFSPNVSVCHPEVLAGLHITYSECWLSTLTL